MCSQMNWNQTKASMAVPWTHPASVRLLSISIVYSYSVYLPLQWRHSDHQGCFLQIPNMLIYFWDAAVDPVCLVLTKGGSVLQIWDNGLCLFTDTSHFSCAQGQILVHRAIHKQTLNRCWLQLTTSHDRITSPRIPAHDCSMSLHPSLRQARFLSLQLCERHTMDKPCSGKHISFRTEIRLVTAWFSTGHGEWPHPLSSQASIQNILQKVGQMALWWRIAWKGLMGYGDLHETNHRKHSSRLSTTQDFFLAPVATGYSLL